MPTQQDTTIESLLHLSELGLDYARRLVADLSEEQMAVQPAAGMNHAAWVLGHLTLTGDLVLSLLGLEAPRREGWQELFGPRSKPVADRVLYPDKATLVAALEASHAAVAEAVRSVDAEVLDSPPAHDRLRARFPTLRPFVIHALTGHEQMHLGQLSAWRRVQGLAAV